MQAKHMALFLLGLSLIGCKKKEEGDSNTSLLVQQIWRYDVAGLDANNDGMIDTQLPAGTIAACSVDNTLTFNSGGTGIIDEGATKCNTSAPQTNPFTWNFLNNETTINLQSTALFGLGGQFKIRELSAAAFRMSKDTSVMGFPVSIVINLKH